MLWLSLVAYLTSVPAVTDAPQHVGGSSGPSRVRVDSLVLTQMSEHRWNYTRHHRTMKAEERVAMQNFEEGGQCVFKT